MLTHCYKYLQRNIILLSRLAGGIKCYHEIVEEDLFPYGGTNYFTLKYVHFYPQYLALLWGGNSP